MGCSTFVQVAPPSGTTYSDTGLQPATSYSYRVRAADAAGNLSGYSTVQSASTPEAVRQPAAHRAERAVGHGFLAEPDQPRLEPLSDDVGVTGYRVERCQGSGCSNFVQVATPSGTTYNDTGRAASTTYSYRVRGGDAAGNLSGYSNVASGTTFQSNGLHRIVWSDSVGVCRGWACVCGAAGWEDQCLRRCVSDSSPVVADLRPNVHDFWDRGLLGLALDPGFTTGRPYVYVSTRMTLRSVAHPRPGATTAPTRPAQPATAAS